MACSCVFLVSFGQMSVMVALGDITLPGLRQLAPLGRGALQLWQAIQVLSHVHGLLSPAAQLPELVRHEFLFQVIMQMAHLFLGLLRSLYLTKETNEQRGGQGVRSHFATSKASWDCKCGGGKKKCAS